jgi:N-acetylmuramoyl-L-alanine amidase
MEGFTTTHSKGIVPVFIAIGAAIVILIIATGVALGLTISEIRKHTGETPIATAGSFCGGTAPETAMELSTDGKTYFIPEGGKGGISEEGHIITKSDPTSSPSNNLGVTSRGAQRSNDGIEKHLEITNFSKNCPSSSSLCDPKKQEWTPGEPSIGRGSTTTPPSEHEPWIMNARWKNADGSTTNPPEGTRVLITNSASGKSVIAVAGYEWGPKVTTGHLLGAQPEVLANLGFTHGTEATFAFAKDQNIAPGAVFGGECAGGSGDTVFIDAGHGKGKNPFKRELNGVSFEGDHNWNIAVKVKALLEKRGLKVVMSKNAVDPDPPLEDRVKIINQSGAGVMVSIHSNSDGGPGPIGIVYCKHSGVANDGDVNYADSGRCPSSPNTEKSVALAKTIISSVSTNIGLGGARYWGGDPGVLTNLNMPGAIIEMFAHDVESDLSKVDGKDDVLAESIANGIASFMGK